MESWAYLAYLFRLLTHFKLQSSDSWDICALFSSLLVATCVLVVLFYTSRARYGMF